MRLMPMRVLRMEDGDILVLQTDLMLDKEQCMLLRDRAQENFGRDFKKIAILTHGMKAGILRKPKKK
jgi:hypothetical protein